MDLLKILYHEGMQKYSKTVNLTENSFHLLGDIKKCSETFISLEFQRDMNEIS